MRPLYHRILNRLKLLQPLCFLQRFCHNKAVSPPSSLSSFAFENSRTNSTRFYKSCVSFFDQKLSGDLKNHRLFFSLNKRGFGEDAFHVMWAMLVEKFRPTSFLEIGVYRGQVLSLVSLLQQKHGIQGTVTGIGPFERIGDDSSVADYGYCEDWLADTYANFEHFQLPRPELVKALSTDQIAIERIKSTQWDMIYIDGNHDYDVVLQDWQNCAPAVKPGGIIVLDDAGLDSGFKAPLYASTGFPGPSKLANAIPTEYDFDEILQVGHNRVFQKRF